jgi:hypothetical protein
MTSPSLPCYACVNLLAARGGQAWRWQRRPHWLGRPLLPGLVPLHRLAQSWRHERESRIAILRTAGRDADRRPILGALVIVGDGCGTFIIADTATRPRRIRETANWRSATRSPVPQPVRRWRSPTPSLRTQLAGTAHEASNMNGTWIETMCGTGRIGLPASSKHRHVGFPAMSPMVGTPVRGCRRAWGGRSRTCRARSRPGGPVPGRA